MYDQTKFEAAFKEWLAKNVTLGFGEHYSGDLLDDFEGFLRETKMMKRSPGRVVFGKALAAQGLDKRKRMGLTYWSGLELNNPPEKDALAPRRYARTQAAQEERWKEQERIRREQEFEESPDAEQARKAAFRRELQSETRENISKVGQDENM